MSIRTSWTASESSASRSLSFSVNWSRSSVSTSVSKVSVIVASTLCFAMVSAPRLVLADFWSEEAIMAHDCGGNVMNGVHSGEGVRFGSPGAGGGCALHTWALVCIKGPPRNNRPRSVSQPPLTTKLQSLLYYIYIKKKKKKIRLEGREGS